MATPYVTPEMIRSAPTGIAWPIIPFPKATLPQQEEEQYNICWRATGQVNAYCNQVLRATVDTEHLSGPDYWLTVQKDTGNARVILRRFPILSIEQIGVTGSNVFPRQYTVVPTGMYAVETPVIGSYGTVAPSAAGDGGQDIVIAPGYVTWALGRNGYTVSTTYVNGWPHAGISLQANPGDMTLNVDDVTGFTGTNAFIFDGSSTESVTITSITATAPVNLPFGGTVLSGPGTLNLSGPLVFSHAPNIVISTMPQDITWATILLCAAQVLEAGITSITIQNISGSETAGGRGVEDLITEAEVILAPYRRTI